MKVPLHFINAEIAPGVKLSGGMVSHVMTEVDMPCLPRICRSSSRLNQRAGVGETIHLSELKLPKGVKLALARADDPVVSASSPRAALRRRRCRRRSRRRVSTGPRLHRPPHGILSAAAISFEHAMLAPRLIVGLGNPGAEYEATRHNVGFWFVDRLADKLKATLAPQGKFFGRTRAPAISGCCSRPPS